MTTTTQPAARALVQHEQASDLHPIDIQRFAETWTGDPLIDCRRAQLLEAAHRVAAGEDLAVPSFMDPREADAIVDDLTSSRLGHDGNPNQTAGLSLTHHCTAWYGVQERTEALMPLDTAPLERAGLSVPIEELEATFNESLAAVVPPYAALDTREAMPADELAFLQRAGITLDELAPLPSHTLPPEARTAGKIASLVGTALPVPEAAARLGIDASSMRHRVAAHTVYSIRVDGLRRLPLFQFTDDLSALVPGFAEIAPSLADLHPIDVFNWFTLPHVDLQVGDVNVSPRDWLMTSGDPSRLVELIDEVRGVA